MSYNNQKLREEIDNYKDTVWATVAFAHECRWNDTAKSPDGSVKVGVGREMTRPDGTVVTPDIVIQKLPTQGTVAEVKHTFPAESQEARRKEIFEQLKAYDVDLRGWWTPTKEIAAHDLVLLTHESHVVDAMDYLTKSLAGTELGKFDHKLAIISYARIEQADLHFKLRKEYGSLLDQKLADKLRKTVNIRLRYLVVHRQVEFSDSPPPAPHLLRLMWQNIFPDMADGIARDAKKGYIPVPVTVDGVTKNLQKFFGYDADQEGNKGIPRTDWVEKALETLRSLHMAHPGDTKGSYVIRYRTLHGDAQERFGRLCHELAEKRKKAKKVSTQRSFDFVNASKESP